MDRLQNFITWYGFTAKLIGIPVLFVLLFVGLQKFVFTSSCMIAGYKCEYSFGAEDAMANFMGDLIASNRDQDIVVKKR